MENIRPSSDLRNKYNEMSTLCKESREPIFITVNGHGDTVLLSYENYLQMKDELELLQKLAIAEDDVLNGRVDPLGTTFKDIRAMLKR